MAKIKIPNAGDDVWQLNPSYMVGKKVQLNNSSSPLKLCIHIHNTTPNSGNVKILYYLIHGQYTDFTVVPVTIYKGNFPHGGSMHS